MAGTPSHRADRFLLERVLFEAFAHFAATGWVARGLLSDTVGIMSA
jgi:hypothetical protein